MNRQVVVGVDGSPSSLVAAEHAARAAQRRSRPLLVVHGYLHAPLTPYDLTLPGPSEEARRMVEGVAADLTERFPGLAVEVRQVAGGPGATMVEESRRAELVVVGSRGLGGFTGLLLGSVGAQVAAHARCPVLVVRPEGRSIDVDGPVLVGVDGSESSQLAVGYGAVEATLRDVPLVLTHVGPSGGDRPVPDEMEEAQAVEQAEAVRLLADASAVVRAEHPDLVVREHPVRASSPAQGLVEASGAASLLVVGTRGRAGFAGLLLGSVSQAAVHHAHCPVLVAHPVS
ncbi:universal stress protein [Micromonospora sp. NPDC005979]|uniref:universal stress protein n=1 Tax=Micromonospora sp. NPDC005979 TaxID=3156726 RepID=UPI0033A06E3C